MLCDSVLNKEMAQERKKERTVAICLVLTSAFLISFEDYVI